MDPTVRSDPQAWPALAEAHRRAGRLDEALEVARDGLRRSPDELRGRVALALTLLDQGQSEAARDALAEAFADLAEPSAPATPAAAEADALAGFDADELEDAFAAAETRTDEMHNANHVAEAALHAIEEGAPEGVWTPDPESPFATGTVADLLARQGHDQPARELSEHLQTRGGPDRAAPLDRQRILATLERWHGNLRRAAS